MLFGFAGVVYLQRKYPDGVKHLGALRVGCEQAAEFDSRVLVALFADQAPGVGQAHILGARIGLQPDFQKIELGRSLGQEFRLEQGRHVPVRTQSQRLVDLAAGAPRVADAEFRLRPHEAGFGKPEIRLGQLLEQAMHRLSVRIAGKSADQPQQGFTGIRGRPRQVTGEARGQFVDTSAGEEQRRLHLPCRRRVRLEAQPEPHRVQGDLVLARMEGNFRRAAHDSRIARGVCQVEQRARSQRVLAALRGNLAQQELVEDLAGKLLLRQPVFRLPRHRRLGGRFGDGYGRGCRRLRPRACARQHQQERKEWGTDFHWHGTSAKPNTMRRC